MLEFSREINERLAKINEDLCKYISEHVKVPYRYTRDVLEAVSQLQDIAIEVNFIEECNNNEKN